MLRNTQSTPGTLWVTLGVAADTLFFAPIRNEFLKIVTTT